jgi:hypothetical protein
VRVPKGRRRPGEGRGRPHKDGEGENGFGPESA